MAHVSGSRSGRISQGEDGPNASADAKLRAMSSEQEGLLAPVQPMRTSPAIESIRRRFRHQTHLMATRDLAVRAAVTTRCSSRESDCFTPSGFGDTVSSQLHNNTALCWGRKHGVPAKPKRPGECGVSDQSGKREPEKFNSTSHAETSSLYGRAPANSPGL